MAIIGQDNRTEVTNFDQNPFDSVVAVDGFQSGGEGSGILISPYHILTAAHVLELDSAVRITLAKDVPNLPTRTTTLFPISDANANRSSGGALGKDNRYNGKTKDGYDIGLITLSNGKSFSDSSEYIGLLAFVDPKDSWNYAVTTAGYPAIVSNIDIDTSKNAEYILRNENGDPLKLSSLAQPNDSAETAAQVLFSATGRVDEVLNNGNLRLSDSIDAERGQSGSGVWTMLKGDKPRVLGVMSRQELGLSRIGIDSDLRKANLASSIDTDAYSRIVEKMKNRLGDDSGNDLPENAIIGSDENDTIKGTYRRERILGNKGRDTILGGEADDRLEGGAGNDVLRGEKGNDRLQGDGGNDFLTGGEGDNDVAIFSDDYTVENYNYEEILGSTFGVEDELITFEHIGGTYADGKDTLDGIEWAQFGGNSDPDVSGPPRIIPLPLEDGVEKTEFIGAVDTTANPNQYDPPTPPHVTLSAPVAMLDGDVEYTLNISPYKPDTRYNIAYIIDTSASMTEFDIQTAQDAYIELTNSFIDAGIAENINFGVVSFGSDAQIIRDSTGERNLTADEAISAIQSLTPENYGNTNYTEALYQGFNFLASSPLRASSPFNPDGTTSISYFFSDGQHSNFSGFTTRGDESRRLRRFSHVRAFGLYEPEKAGAVRENEIDFADSNDGVLINEITDLSAELQKSGLAGSVASVNILLDGEVVETVTPDQLTDSPLGLTYEGTVEELDVSIDAENIITAEVVFADGANLATTTVEHIVAAGEGEVVDSNGNPIDELGNNSGDENPFERERDGGDGDDEITLGYGDRGANGGAGGDYIIGNRRDNILNGGSGNDTIIAHEGNDTIITGAGTDKVDGGEGIDTVVYGDVTYLGNNSIYLRTAANTVNYNGIDTLTDIEFIQFADVRISGETLAVTPTIEVSDISVIEGERKSFSLKLDTPAPVDVVFDYSTEDITATAESDYTATEGTFTIPAGETTAKVSVEVSEDTVYDEETEAFALNLSGLIGATFSNNETEFQVAATIENIEQALTLNGNAEDNFLTGGNNNDRMYGKDGNDTLDGGAGRDTLRGDGGNDLLTLRW